jgi:hypothetical protein
MVSERSVKQIYCEAIKLVCIFGSVEISKML